MMCPYCGTDFKIEQTITENNQEIINGILKCACSHFPILKGILILNEELLNENIIRLIKDKEIEKATTICLWNDHFERIKVERTSSLTLPFPKQITNRLQYLLSVLAEETANKKFQKLYKKYSDNDLSFCDLIENNLFGKYLKYRFSSDSFWSLYPFLSLIKEKNSKILDLSCGTGHFSFVLSQYVGPSELCCADKYFSLLYLARKYFAPNAEFVCLDFNNTLPFKNNAFSSILMADALMLVHSRFSLIHEIERLLMQDGFSLFLHVHNSLGKNLEPVGSYGKGMTPKQWRMLFETTKLNLKILSEKQVLDNYLSQNILLLQDETNDGELNSSNALIILATIDSEIFRKYDNAKRILLSARKNLIINPIYKIRQENNILNLSRPSLTIDNVGDFYPIAEKYLPKEIQLQKDIFDNDSTINTNKDSIEELIRSFVIINTPSKYI
jgi:ubiquinone/menaquinone biosynthesis C-methylase UbiE